VSDCVLEEMVRFRASPALADAIGVAAARQGRSVSDFMRHLAAQGTALDERAHDDPAVYDSELIERAASGLAGAHIPLIERAASASPEDKDKLLAQLIGFVVYLAAPRVSAEDVKQFGDMVARRMGGTAA
jgi:hypothetical protein